MGRKSKYDTHEVEVVFVHETPDAILVQEDTESTKVWLPKSKITYRTRKTSAGVLATVEAPEWLLELKNLDHLV